MTGRLIRLSDAAVTLGYSPGYGREIVPKLLPVYRAPSQAPNAPLCVLSEDLDRLLAEVAARPVKGSRR